MKCHYLGTSPWRCPAEAVKNHHFCQKHLDYYATRQAQFEAQQRQQGLCVSCSRRVYRGGRCRRHYLMNRARIRAWAKANGRARFQRVVASGFCSCRNRLPLAPGKTKCQVCLDRHRAAAKWREYCQDLGRCRLLGCTEATHARGLCLRHYDDRRRRNWRPANPELKLAARGAPGPGAR